MSKQRILLTGAAGRVGKILRAGLADHFDLRLLDLVPIPDAPDMLVGDMNDSAGLDRALQGVDAVIHLAAQAWEGDFIEDVIPRNILGMYNLYEACQRNAVRRVVFASTNHTVEAHSPLLHDRVPHWAETTLAPVTYPLSTDGPVRPDNLYGVSKVFGEALARYYADYRGVTSVCIRLGAIGPRQTQTLASPRYWGLFISDRDACQLFRCAVEAEGVGCAIVYGISGNTRRWWEIETARTLLGYQPEDDSEAHIPDWIATATAPQPPPLSGEGSRASPPSLRGKGGGGVGPARPAATAPPPSYPLPWRERLAALPARDGHAYLVAIGQSGFYLKSPTGVKLAIDPFLTDWPDRIQPPLMTADQVPADVILITHNHRDHLDVYALPSIAQANPQARFVAPPVSIARLAELGIGGERVQAVQPGDTLQLGDLTITTLPAVHQDTAPDAVGYLVHAPGVKVYHTGDTLYGPFLQAAAAHQPDVLIVPINGRGGNMTGAEAAQLAADLNVRHVIPIHYGVLQPKDDPNPKLGQLMLDGFLTALPQTATQVTPAIMELGAILRLPLA